MTNTESRQEQPAKHKREVFLHVSSWAIMIVMTIVAFVAVGMELMSPMAVIGFIVILAVIQVFGQVYIFMHMKDERMSTQIWILYGLFLGGVFALGLWWMSWGVH